jgi:hypothetical protein
MTEIPIPSDEKIAAIAKAKGLSEDDVRAVFLGNVEVDAGDPVGYCYRELATGDTATRVFNGGLPMWLIGHLSDDLAPSFINGNLPPEGWQRIYPPAG